MGTVTYLQDRRTFLKDRRQALELKVDQIKSWIRIASTDAIEGHRAIVKDLDLHGYITPYTLTLVELSNSEVIQANDALNALLVELDYVIDNELI